MSRRSQSCYRLDFRPPLVDELFKNQSNFKCHSSMSHPLMRTRLCC